MADPNDESSSAEVPEAPRATVADRVVIGLICAPVTFFTGWGFILLLLTPLTPNPDWVARVVGFFLAEFAGAIFFVFFFATAWAVTGSERFDRLIFRRLGRLALLTLLFVTAVVVLAIVLA